MALQLGMEAVSAWDVWGLEKFREISGGSTQKFWGIAHTGKTGIICIRPT